MKKFFQTSNIHKVKKNALIEKEIPAFDFDDPMAFDEVLQRKNLGRIRSNEEVEKEQ